MRGELKVMVRGVVFFNGNLWVEWMKTSDQLIGYVRK